MSDLYHGEYPVDMTPGEARSELERREPKHSPAEQQRLNDRLEAQAKRFDAEASRLMGSKTLRQVMASAEPLGWHSEDERRGWYNGYDAAVSEHKAIPSSLALAEALSTATGIQSGPNGNGRMKVVIDGLAPGEEFKLHALLSASFARENGGAK